MVQIKHVRQVNEKKDRKYINEYHDESSKLTESHVLIQIIVNEITAARKKLTEMKYKPHEQEVMIIIRPIKIHKQHTKDRGLCM